MSLTLTLPLTLRRIAVGFGVGRRRRHLEFLCGALLCPCLPGRSHHDDGKDEAEQPHSATAILCDHHVASPQFLWFCRDFLKFRDSRVETLDFCREMVNLN